MSHYDWSEDTVFVIPPYTRGIGDQLQFTRIPEMYHREFGLKACFFVDDRYGIFQSNPYVEVVSEMPTGKDPVNLWKCGAQFKFIPGTPVYRQLRLFMDHVEDDNIKPTMGYLPAKIKEKPVFCFASQGKEKAGCPHWKLPLDGIRFLTKTLPDEWEIWQVGGLNDLGTNDERVIDYRGRSVPDTYDLLGAVTLFLGLNSGMTHLANCIPSIWVMVYVDGPVALPISENDPRKWPHHHWLYDDNLFVNHISNLNVVTFKSVIRCIARGGIQWQKLWAR